MINKTLLEEFKMLFGGITIQLSPNVIKEAYGAIYEIDRELSNDLSADCAWRSVRYAIEEYLLLRPDAIIKQIYEKNISPRVLIYNMACNISEQEIEVLSSDSVSRVGSIIREYISLNTYVVKKIAIMNRH